MRLRPTPLAGRSRSNIVIEAGNQIQVEAIGGMQCQLRPAAAGPHGNQAAVAQDQSLMQRRDPQAGEVLTGEGKTGPIEARRERDQPVHAKLRRMSRSFPPPATRLT